MNTPDAINPLHFLENWPSNGPGNHSKLLVRAIAMIRSLATTVQLLEDKLASLTKDVTFHKVHLSDQALRLTELESKSHETINDASQALPKTFSQIVADISKVGSDANVAIVNAVASHKKMHDDRAKKVRVSGLSITDGDIAEFKKVMEELQLNGMEFKVIGRSTQKNSSRNTNAKYQPTLLVQFTSESDRNKVLASSSALSRSANFKNVFIRPDRTIAEQTKFAQLNEERKNANLDLDKLGKLNNPYRFVVFRDRLQCVNVKSTVTFNGVVRHGLVNWSEACRARTAQVSLAEASGVSASS
jgi:hypothetical protein